MTILRLGLLSSLLLLGTPVGAQEFRIDSATSAAGGSLPGSTFLFSERLTGHFTLPFDGRGNGLKLKAHVQYGVPSGLGYDLDELSFTFFYEKPAADLQSFKWTFGRYPLDEPTGLILNHPGDGLKFGMDYRWLNLSLSAAYTGLIQKNSSGTALSLADLNATERLLASPRFIGSIEASFVPLFEQRMIVAALAQQDLNSRDNLTNEYATVNTPTRGGALDTQYVTLKVSGPIVAVDRLDYSIFGTFGGGTTLSWIKAASSPTGYIYEYRPISSFLSAVEVSYGLPDLFDLNLNGRILAASGDSDATSPIEGNTEGDLTLFTAITGSSLGAVFSPALSNLICYELAADAQPLSEVPLTVGTKLLGFQRVSTGLINAPGVQRLGPTWIGQELDVSARWSVFSDMTLNCSIGAFVPTAGTYMKGSVGADFQYVANVGLDLRF